MAGEPFSGSYLPEDVTFLLNPVSLAPTPVRAKERLIQGGTHYSEMIGPEALPDPVYLRLYEEALARNGARLGADVAALASALTADRREVVIASLARAGTPIGVLLRRELARRGIPVAHYSISIIRDRGVDRVALAHIAARHDPAEVLFVDGWTGKGAIADELERSLADRRFGFQPRLAVVTDPAGRAAMAAGHEDYLVPSGLLGAVVSGLVSRSVLSAATVGPGDFHACVSYPELAPHDQSRAFVDTVAAHAAVAPVSAPAPVDASETRRRAEAAVAAVMDAAHVDDRNRVKPGIAEATRALLRRVPDRLFLADPSDPDVAHLRHLAARSGTAIEQLPAGSRYRAVAVIAAVGPREGT